MEKAISSNKCVIDNCYSSCQIDGETDNVGGLLGYFGYGTVTNSYSNGNVSGNSSVGGFVGQNLDIIENCYATGQVTANYTAGGFVGDNRDTITNSYATGNVNGKRCLGGFVGTNNKNIGNCYATGVATRTINKP